MRKIVECVPNFSEGRDQKIIDAIGESIRRVNGVKLLSVEPDKDYNRSVVTFIGEPSGVVEAAFQATKAAAQLIDMTKHKGEHPRMGATDVVPFIPISGVTMEDCVQLAHRYGKRVASELKIPTYLYEYAAQSPERRNLANIRKGEYEGLAGKLKDPKWKPDYGEPVFNAKSGATVTGARKFLIAYNINLNTPDSAFAHEIALRIRESGRPKKDEAGNVMKNEKGEKIIIPGSLKAVKAMGVLVERFHIAQVSINLVDYETTSLHTAFETVKKEARALGIDATGSEIVGLTPLKALLMAGEYYASQKKKVGTQTEEDLVGLAVKGLGLSQLEPFDPKKKVIEYQLQHKPARFLKPRRFHYRSNIMLTEKTVAGFLDDVASNSAAPGGGSVAALAGALGAGLTAMVCRLTVGKKKYAEVEAEMQDVLRQTEELRAQFTTLIDKDTEAFNSVMRAFSLPKDTEEERYVRSAGIQEATKAAALVPLTVMELCERTLPLTFTVATKGNVNSLSDTGVAAAMLHAACLGAALNVRINLGTIQDDTFVHDTSVKAEGLLAAVEQRSGEIMSHVNAAIS